ncbi:MAG: septation protein SpoVG family protein [Candidatus Omnitrophota bacterium]|nr:septation protein SpoVG family protein [Candidatus Omnitrophota bacterium]
MEITEVKVALKDLPDKKLKGYVSVTFDDSFVVRNIKVIEGSNGLFIAMPSKKIKQPCPKCGFKNEVRSKYCNQCAASLPLPNLSGHSSFGAEGSFSANRPLNHEAKGMSQLEHKDIAHPITQPFREYLQKKVLDAYEQEKLRG